jgi:hypothetical protein
LDGLLLPIQTGNTTVTVGYGLPPGSPTVVAPIVGLMSNTTVSAAANPGQVTSVQIQPRNVQYGTTAALPVTGTGNNYPLYLTAFLDNGTVASVGGKATWTLTPQNSGQSLAGILINTSTGTATLQLNVPSQANPQAFNVTATASYQGFTDSMVFQILPGLARGGSRGASSLHR